MSARGTKLSRLWWATGLDGRTGRKIEFRMHLPCGVTATIRRWQIRGPWYWWLGTRTYSSPVTNWPGNGPFKYRADAAGAAEAALRDQLALALKRLEGVRVP